MKSNKYEIYHTNNVQPITTVEAVNFHIDYELKRIKFIDNNSNLIACFNWNNISGFKKLEE